MVDFYVWSMLACFGALTVYHGFEDPYEIGACGVISGLPFINTLVAVLTVLLILDEVFDTTPRK